MFLLLPVNRVLLEYWGPDPASLKKVGVWILAAGRAELVGQWKGIISFYLLVKIVLDGVQLVPVKLDQAQIRPGPTCGADVCSHSPGNIQVRTALTVIVWLELHDRCAGFTPCSLFSAATVLHVQLQFFQVCSSV